jgi:hypothetical protein
MREDLLHSRWLECALVLRFLGGPPGAAGRPREVVSDGAGNPRSSTRRRTKVLASNQGCDTLVEVWWRRKRHLDGKISALQNTGRLTDS